MLKYFLCVVVLVSCGEAVPTTPMQEAPGASVDDVRFLLWTKSNSGDGAYYEVVLDDSGSLNGSPLNANDPTVVLIHGFSSSGDSGWPVDAKTELLKQGSYNVISVDWGKLAAAPWYLTAVANVPLVGAHTATFLDWLKASVGLDTSKLQITGHSLGAHVSGAVGQNVASFTVPAITGLDPAGPEFYSKPTSERLDASDAAFVQIIHTNGGEILQSCVGLADTAGQVDFFPNGGVHQPGCVDLGEWTDLLEGGCSHGRSHLFWVESINGSPAFRAHPCDDWTSYENGQCSSCGAGCLEMGFHVSRSLRGTYFLTTNSDPPYAQG
ncbi:pancreatic triacylglycerol lipase-like [Procambarus clarkii]|uniref:pancreatic triacylglycerol lipase n=1 Tax=Procambarus clarkii TaxID=6728 RepID=UPI001E671BFB|nr:pancreatic triacylglycerol lipase-like [Procambarus clarkii]